MVQEACFLYNRSLLISGQSNLCAETMLPQQIIRSAVLIVTISLAIKATSITGKYPVYYWYSYFSKCGLYEFVFLNYTDCQLLQKQINLFHLYFLCHSSCTKSCSIKEWKFATHRWCKSKTGGEDYVCIIAYCYEIHSSHFSWTLCKPVKYYLAINISKTASVV
jgi:hypothetical protein